MNSHYLELQMFLKRLQDTTLDKAIRKSESRLYGTDSKLNHRVSSKFQLIQDCHDGWDDTLLFRLVTLGTAAMEAKLSSYARNQLPEFF